MIGSNRLEQERQAREIERLESRARARIRRAKWLGLPVALLLVGALVFGVGVIARQPAEDPAAAASAAVVAAAQGRDEALRTLDVAPLRPLVSDEIAFNFASGLDSLRAAGIYIDAKTETTILGAEVQEDSTLVFVASQERTVGTVRRLEDSSVVEPEQEVVGMYSYAVKRGTDGSWRLIAVQPVG